MFGYVTILKDELRIREFREYKAVYCSLCRTLGREYGIFARFILSYDCTFYALLLRAMQKPSPCYEKRRCRFNPLKKCFYLRKSEEVFKKASALSVSSVYYKILDNISDSKGIKKLVCKVIIPIVKHWEVTAEKRYPEICKSVGMMFKNQSEVEKLSDCHLDLAAQPTAEMLSSVMSPEAKNKNEKLVLHTLGYNLGRWIYFIDAVDDIADDEKNGNFNPFLKFKSRADFKEYCSMVLNQCLSNVYNAFQLLEIYNYEEIIENILLKGLAARQRKVLFSEEK